LIAEAIFTGTEMLLGQVVNTNAAFLGQKLAEIGINFYRYITVGDNLERIREAIENARSRADIIIIGGGLGPTEDDLSREALAAALGLPLVEDNRAKENVTRYFRARRRTMPASNMKQALVPEGAVVLDNPNGTAAGMLLQHDNKIYALLPGPPREFEPMLTNRLLPLLTANKTTQSTICSRIIKMTGIGESAVEEKVADLLSGSNPTLAPLAKPGEVALRVTARAKTLEDARKLISPLEKTICTRLDDYIFGFDDDTLEGVVSARLSGNNLTLATAESCTGGLLSSRLTNIPGSSIFFLGGFVSYSNEAKIKYLKVEPETLNIHGAVSPEVAAAMARGARRALGADIGIGITGIAGPGGGSPAKPVGLVYLGLDFKCNVETRKELFTGERKNIKYLSSQSALFMLWQSLKRYEAK